MFEFAWNRKHTSNAGRVGLLLASDGFTLCHIVQEEAPPVRLELCRSVTALTPEERKDALGALVRESNLEGLPCVVVLPSERYSLQLLDRPNVEDQELASSLPFLIKDVVDFDTAEATVDSFDFPIDATRGRSPRLFVAATRNSVVEEVVDLLSESRLELAAIDVAELALRNLVEAMPSQVAGTVLLDLGLKGGLLTIYHEAQLYFARSISIGTSQIDDAVGSEISIDDRTDHLSDHVQGLLDELLLEVQRSLDYYESELGKAPASRLVIMPSNAEVSPYIPYLSEQLRPVNVSQLDLTTLVEYDAVLGNELQASATLALGGALRGELEQELDLSQVAESAPDYTTLPLAWVAKVCALAFCGLMMICAVGVHQNVKLSNELEAGHLRHDQIQQQLTELEGIVTQSHTGEDASDPLAELRAERDKAAGTLRQLDEISGDRRGGFSKYFVGFARQLVPDLWLTRIAVLEGGASLSIHGSTLAAKRVPQLLRRLRSEPSFAAKTFGLFRLTSSEQAGVLDFALESKAASEVVQ